ncbi:MAG: hypothetical protein WCL44_07735 [bacterium]
MSQEANNDRLDKAVNGKCTACVDTADEVDAEVSRILARLDKAGGRPVAGRLNRG